MFDISRAMLEAHSLDMRQFIDARVATLATGQRVIDVYNSSGFTFTILPDRGFDIWSAMYHCTPLTWLSPGSPHRPDFGAGWLRQFNGGLLTTCGLTHAGPPEIDDETGESRDIHGLYTRLPAHNIRIDGRWQDERYVLIVCAEMYESSLFGAQLCLTRSYRIVLGEPGFDLIDRVENLADRRAPLMLVYHFNLGYPLVREGTRLIVPSHRVLPRDEPAMSGYENWEIYGPAEEGYAEQVFFHHVLQAGMAQVMLTNGDVSLSLSWDAQRAPYFTQWKNIRRGIYVSGIEPGNCVPEGLNTARREGRVQWLQPGEAVTFTNRLRMVSGAGIGHFTQQIERLKQHGQPAPGFNPPV